MDDSQKIDRLQSALAAAAASLETISTQSGKNEFLDDFANVRGYAASRAAEARKALAERTAGALNTTNKQVAPT